MKRYLGTGLLAVVLSASLISCGGSGAATAPTPGGSASASSGNMKVTASPANLRAGGTVHVRLTVRGPATYEVGCVQTLHIWVLDSNGAMAWTEREPGVECMAIAYQHLPAGKTAQFLADWRTDRSTASGRYTVHGLFLYFLPPGAGTRVRENLPPVSVEITG